MISRPSLTVWTAVLLVACVAGTGPAIAAKKRGEDRFISGTRQLTYEGRRSGECYFSPDGKQLVFMSEREPENPFFQIYVLDLETGHALALGMGLIGLAVLGSLTLTRAARAR